MNHITKNDPLGMHSLMYVYLMQHFAGQRPAGREEKVNLKQLFFVF